MRSYDYLFDDESKMASSTADVAATEDASASIAFEDDFMVRRVLPTLLLKGTFCLIAVLTARGISTCRRAMCVEVERVMPRDSASVVVFRHTKLRLFVIITTDAFL